MQDLFGELKMKLSIEEETISLDALELLTRGTEQGGAKGLKRAVTEIVTECAQRQKM